MRKYKISVFFLMLMSFFALVAYSYAQQSESGEVRTRVGDPPENTAGCWPTSGNLSQGPLGAASHAGVQRRGGGPSVDITSGLGTPLYATFNGTVQVYDCTGRGVCIGGYGNLVRLIPDSNPSALVYYGHLSTILVENGQNVSKGQRIGLMGATGYVTGVHLHYEFRNISFSPPNLPQNITPSTCNGVGSCSPISVTSNCSASAIKSVSKNSLARFI